MSNKLFYKSIDRLSITSYKRANIRLLAEHCITDVKKLSLYLHKIVQFRLFYIKYLFLYVLAGKQMHLAYCSEFNIMFMRYFATNITADIFHVFYTSHFYKILLLSNNVHSTYGLLIGYYVFSAELYKFTVFYKKGLSSLPTSYSKYTVLRSPHTDKKSREQFERCIHRKVYTFPSMLSEYFALLCTSHYAYMSCNIVSEQSEYFNE